MMKFVCWEQTNNNLVLMMWCRLV